MNSGVAGLGLAIAKQVIEAHDGKILVESAGKGQGSQFIFRIPVKRQEEVKTR